MNRIKKLTQLGFLFITVFAMSCSKTDTPQQKNHNDTNCSEKGTVVSMDCVGNYLGIVDDENNYFYIETDHTNSFSDYKEGDKVCFGYDECDGPQTHMPASSLMNYEATSINLTCIKDCACNSGCRAVKAVNQLPSDTLPNQILKIIEMSQDGNTLNMRIAFSGCDTDIEPDVLAMLQPNGTGSMPSYSCVLRENRVQLCYAHFEKDICFDLSKLRGKNTEYEMVFDTPEGSKTITIRH